MTTPKQKLYKTAYSRVHRCYCAIENAHQDSDGRWIYKCVSPEWPDCTLHREEELTNLAL